MVVDIVGPRLELLFVGYNPSPASAESGHHYAGRNNQFWRLLAAAGLTPRLLGPQEDRQLPTWGLGSTNLVRRPTPGSSDLTANEMRSGVPRLRRFIESHRPKVVAYVGKGVYLAVAGRSRADWGRQEERHFRGAEEFVLPSSSGRVRMTFEEKLVHYRELAELLERTRASS